VVPDALDLTDGMVGIVQSSRLVQISRRSMGIDERPPIFYEGLTRDCFAICLSSRVDRCPRYGGILTRRDVKVVQIRTGF